MDMTAINQEERAELLRQLDAIQKDHEEALEHYPGLAGLDYARRWLDGFIAVAENWLVTISAVLLTVGIGVAMYDFFSAGTAFQNETVRNAWAIVQTLAVDSQFLLMWYRCKIAIQERKFWAALGYMLLGLGLAIVTFGTNAIPSLQLAKGHGFTFEQATQQMNIDPILLVYVRTVVLVVLAVMAAFNREAIDFRSGSKISGIRRTKISKLPAKSEKKQKAEKPKKERVSLRQKWQNWRANRSKKEDQIVAESATNSSNNSQANVTTNVVAIQTGIASESTPDSSSNSEPITGEIELGSVREIGADLNINHEENNSASSFQFSANSVENTGSIEPETSADLSANSNQFYGYIEEQINRNPEPFVNFDSALNQDTEEPEEDPTEPELKRSEEPEESNQAEPDKEVSRASTSSSTRRSTTTAHKAVAMQNKFKTAEEIADSEEVKKALNYIGRGAALRRLQVVSDAIAKGDLRPYAGAYSRNAIEKWLEDRKETA